MNNKLLIVRIAVILIAVVLLTLGFGAGYFLKSSKAQRMEGIIKSLEFGKVVSSIAVFGQVANISGRIVTLNQGEDSMAIKIRDNAIIYSFSSAGGKTTKEQKKAEFSEIKIGDRLNAGIKLVPGGDFEAVSVIIIPAVESK